MGLKSFVSTKVTIGFGCFEVSNGEPGGGVCAKLTVELRSPQTQAIINVTGRNIANIIIDAWLRRVSVDTRNIGLGKRPGKTSAGYANNHSKKICAGHFNIGY